MLYTDGPPVKRAGWRSIARTAYRALPGCLAGLLPCLMLLGPILTGPLEAAEEQEPPEEVVLNYEGFRPNRKGPVSFSHVNHVEDYEVACTECHHVYKDGENVWEEGDPVKRCHECHDPSRNQGKIKKLSIAFHKNCKGCHRSIIQEGISDQAPYKSCYDCHERSS